MITHGNDQLIIEEIEVSSELASLGHWDFTAKGTFHEMGAQLRRDQVKTGAVRYIVTEHEDGCWIVWRMPVVPAASQQPAVSQSTLP